MSSQSPATVLYDSTGTALAVYNNTALVANQPSVLFAGYDGYNNVTRYNAMGAIGNSFVSQASNNVVVLSNATITNPGSDIYSAQFFGMQEVSIVVNVVNAPTGTGTPTLTFTIQEVDPGNGTTTYGNSASTTGITAAGVFTATLNITTSSAVKVSWTISGTTPSFSGVYVTLTTKATPSTQTINGTVTSTNNSVGADGSAFLGFDTQVGGRVVGAAPTYTPGNLNALTLDVGGNLRVVTNKAGTSAVTSVAQATSNTVILASNTSRVFASVYNETGQKMYIKLGTTASVTSYTIQLMPNSYWEVPNDYTGEIDAVWQGSGSGNARVTELTP